MIIISIDFRKIDQSRLKRVTRRNGDTASFGDLILIENKGGTDDRGNDGFVKQGTSKEDRDAGVEMPIIGNWKHAGVKKRSPAPMKKTPNRDPDLDPADEDPIPF